MARCWGRGWSTCPFTPHMALPRPPSATDPRPCTEDCQGKGASTMAASSRSEAADPVPLRPHGCHTFPDQGETTGILRPAGTVHLTAGGQDTVPVATGEPGQVQSTRALSAPQRGEAEVAAPCPSIPGSLPCPSPRPSSHEEVRGARVSICPDTIHRVVRWLLSELPDLQDSRADVCTCYLDHSGVFPPNVDPSCPSRPFSSPRSFPLLPSFQKFLHLENLSTACPPTPTRGSSSIPGIHAPRPASAHGVPASRGLRCPCVSISRAHAAPGPRRT